MYWLTGAYAYNAYCGTTSGGPYYLQTPQTITVAIANNGLNRSASGIVTVTTSATEPLTKWQSITIAGATGCTTSPNGTQTVATTNYNPATTFTFVQAGTIETCGGNAATASYFTGIGTAGHYAGDTLGSGTLLSAYTGSGTNPPVSNTATIDPIQVAYNAARKVNSATQKQGSVILSDAPAYNLTTPLIVGNYGPQLLGDHGPIDSSGAGAGAGSGPQVVCAWSDANTGCVMMMGGEATIKGISIIATGTTTHALWAGGDVGDMNSLTLEGVYLQSNAMSTGAAFRAYHVQEAHQWRFKDVTASGSQFVYYISNSIISDWEISMGRMNCGTNGSAITQASGPSDTDHGKNYTGYKSIVTMSVLYVDTESCSSKQGTIDFGGGFLHLGPHFTNSDGTHPAGTVAIINLWDDTYANGAAQGGLELASETEIFGSANAPATILVNAPFGTYNLNGLFFQSGSVIKGSTSTGTSYALDLNSGATPVVTVGPGGVNFDPNSVSSDGSQVRNLGRYTSGGYTAIGGIGSTNMSGVGMAYNEFSRRITLRAYSPTSHLRAFDFEKNTNTDTMRLLGSDSATVHWQDDTSGNFSVAGTLGFKGIASGNGMTFTGSFTGRRSAAWPDGNVAIPAGTLATTSQLPLTGTSSSLGGSALSAGTCSSTAVNVTGATTRMAVSVSPVADPGAGFSWMGFVSSSDTVTVRLCAVAAGTPRSTPYNIRVIQ